MNRREFLAVFGGAVAAAAAAEAQQSPVRLIGFLNSASPAPFANYVAAFRRGLQETGYTEGQNLGIEFRWAEGQNEKLGAMAADLVSRDVAVKPRPAAHCPHRPPRRPPAPSRSCLRWPATR